MANLKTLDGDGAAKYLSASGAGTDGDPHIINQAVTLSGDLPDTAAGDLAALVAVLADPATQTTLAQVLSALQGTLTVDGSGVTQPVSGTVTETNSAAILADTASMDTNLGTVAGSVQSVDDALGATPSGQVMLASRDDALSSLTPVEGDAVQLRVDANGALWIVHSGTVTVDGSGVTQPVSGTVTVQDGGGALTVDGTVTETNSAAILADTAAMDTNLATVAGAVSGSEIQADIVASLPAGDNNIGNVDIASALPAGTNAIGKLAANSGVDIGDVDILSIAAGENVIGLVGASDNVVTITCSLPTGALTAGDVMFDTQAIASAARTSGGTVILQSVQVLDKDDQGAEFDLVFLDANTSIGTEDSAVSITDANAEDILGHVKIETTDYCDLVGSQIATKTGIGLQMQTSGSTSLYVAGITRGTPTYSASGVLIKFGFLRS